MKSKLKITFAGFNDAQAVALAQLGQSDKVIMRDTKLTTGQISYRLRRAKETMGNKEGFRVAWRNGTSPICELVKRDMLAIIRQEIQRKVPPQLVHPEAKGASE